MSKLKGFIFFITFLTILVWNIQSIHFYFYSESWFGTLKSPLSDALAPWLHGALVFYFDEFPIGYLYRPTIGLLYASFITLFKNFYYIPYFILGYYVLHLACTFAFASSRLKIIILGFLLIVNIRAQDFFFHISPQSIAPDFFSFVLVTIGLCNLFLSIEKKALSLY
ncbi:MAG: hypothetical protein N3A69_15930, partial [Leptospiraceae bacterium]|nr:hypothetical protein [Leptospiraceae bacterium]